MVVYKVLIHMEVVLIIYVICTHIYIYQYFTYNIQQVIA